MTAEPPLMVHDLGTGWINKCGEELCGDRVVLWKDPEQTLIILADGLGSGVKANILSTLTTRIALTMLKNGESVGETLETLLNTLPSCKIRGIAYCTVTIIRIDRTGLCRIVEFDNPPVFIVRNHRLLPVQRTAEICGGKSVLISELQLLPGDALTVVSDGAIHAGLGVTFNHGWEWSNAGSYLCRIHADSGAEIARQFLDTCNTLYGGRPGDDTSVATLLYKPMQETHVLVGPPSDPGADAEFVKGFASRPGVKVICGGTTAAIAARVLRQEIRAALEYVDPTVPPVGFIEGIDLVTEGVVTLNRVLECLEIFERDILQFDPAKADGATQLCRLLLFRSTHIHFWIGTAENPAHQHPDFYQNYVTKSKAISQLTQILERIGKQVFLEKVI